MHDAQDPDGEGSARKDLINVLWLITYGIILLNIVDSLLGEPFWQVTRLIYVGGEGNFATWFSSFMLVIAAYYAYKCSEINKAEQQSRRVWKVTALVLLFMSCDEVAQIHEHVGNTINDYLVISDTIKHAAWVFTVGPIAVLAMVFLYHHIAKQMSQSSRAKRSLQIGICAFISGAFLLEMTLNFLNYDELKLVWVIENIVEESLEMIGVLLIIKGLMEHSLYLSKKSLEERTI